jgi:hypothetical protein
LEFARHINQTLQNEGVSLQAFTKAAQ